MLVHVGRADVPLVRPRVDGDAVRPGLERDRRQRDDARDVQVGRVLRRVAILLTLTLSLAMGAGILPVGASGASRAGVSVCRHCRYGHACPRTVRRRTHLLPQFPQQVLQLRHDQPVIASSTALVDPGMANSSLPRATPPQARLSIAPLPICSHDSIRNSSPNPGSGLSSSRSTTSIVWSRRLTPVPPLVRMTSTSVVGEQLAEQRLEPAGSSGMRWYRATRVAGLGQQPADRLAAGVGRLGPGVAERDDRDAGRRAAAASDWCRV